MLFRSNETDKLPKADMIIANLLIEYIGYECFQNAVQHVNPKYVSSIIQINIENTWISDSRKSYLTTQNLETVCYTNFLKKVG